METEGENTPQSRIIIAHISEQSLPLPEEIIEEIFSRLPVKSLLKFRCVSKSWRSLIDSKRFFTKHLNNSTKNASFAHHGIILNAMEPNRELKQCSLRSMLDDPFTDHFKSCDLSNAGKDANTIDVVGCCNGLVCILIDRKRFMLWNPSTKMTKNLPPIDYRIKHGHVTCYGFGFDEFSGDYKVFGVVSLFWVIAGYQALAKVYSLETNSWKLVEFGKVTFFGGQGMFAGGRLHWLRNFGSRSVIASFDLRSEVYGVVEGPSYPESGFGESMGVVWGCLSIINHYKCGRKEIWIMKQYGVRDSWQKVATIPRLNIPLERSRSPLFAVGPNGEILLTYASNFVIYYPEENGYRQCQVKTLDTFREAGVYVESLASLVPYAVE